MVDEDEENRRKARPTFKNKTTYRQAKQELGEEILNEASFRESLRDLIMGDFE